jgi:hypothetical protein
MQEDIEFDGKTLETELHNKIDEVKRTTVLSVFKKYKQNHQICDKTMQVIFYLLLI